MEKYNFNAGPSMLPREVVEQTAAAVLDYDGMGLSLMELSHRSAEFKPILRFTVARRLLHSASTRVLPSSVRRLSTARVLSI